MLNKINFMWNKGLNIKSKILKFWKEFIKSLWFWGSKEFFKYDILSILYFLKR